MGGGKEQRRPRTMVHPGRGARAQYTSEYKQYLDAEYTPSAMGARSAATQHAVTTLASTLDRVEGRVRRALARTSGASGVTFDEVRAHITGCARTVRKLTASAPDAPPVRWSRMRSLEMHAYRRQLRAFDKWDKKVTALTSDVRQLQQALAKCARPSKRSPQAHTRTHISTRTRIAPPTATQVDAMCQLAGGSKRRYYVLVKA